MIGFMKAYTDTCSKAWITDSHSFIWIFPATPNIPRNAVGKPQSVLPTGSPIIQQGRPVKRKTRQIRIITWIEANSCSVGDEMSSASRGSRQGEGESEELNLRARSFGKISAWAEKKGAEIQVPVNQFKCANKTWQKEDNNGNEGKKISFARLLYFVKSKNSILSDHTDKGLP